MSNFGYRSTSAYHGTRTDPETILALQARKQEQEDADDLIASLNITPSMLSWRVRPAFSIPISWTEVGLYIALAVGIQMAYSLFSFQSDVEDQNQFPIDKINPLKRGDLMANPQPYVYPGSVIRVSPRPTRDDDDDDDDLVDSVDQLIAADIDAIP